MEVPNQKVLIYLLSIQLDSKGTCKLTKKTNKIKGFKKLLVNVSGEVVIVALLVSIIIQFIRKIEDINTIYLLIGFALTTLVFSVLSNSFDRNQLAVALKHKYATLGAVSTGLLTFAIWLYSDEAWSAAMLILLTGFVFFLVVVDVTQTMRTKVSTV